MQAQFAAIEERGGGREEYADVADAAAVLRENVVAETDGEAGFGAVWGEGEGQCGDRTGGGVGGVAVEDGEREGALGEDELGRVAGNAVAGEGFLVEVCPDGVDAQQEAIGGGAGGFDGGGEEGRRGRGIRGRRRR